MKTFMMSINGDSMNCLLMNADVVLISCNNIIFTKGIDERIRAFFDISN